MPRARGAGGAAGGRGGALGTRLAVFAALVVVPAAPASGQDVRGVFANVSPSVVVIRGRGRDVGVNGRGLTAITEVGSGVVVSVDGDVMTAAHVVQAMDEITVEFACGPTVPAHVIASEPAADLALLRVRTPPRSLIARSEEHTSELQSPCNLVCRLLLEKKKKKSKKESSNDV